MRKECVAKNSEHPKRIAICAQVGIKPSQLDKYEMARRPAINISYRQNFDDDEVIKEIVDEADAVEDEVARRQSVEKAKGGSIGHF